VNDEVPFWLVVEPQEADAYRQQWGAERVLVLPFSNLGSVTHARNWIKDHSIALGAARHWQLDDNMRAFRRVWKKRRWLCNAGVALRLTEDFVDRYTNVAIAGLNYSMFVVRSMPPFMTNQHVYSCTLFLNSLPHRWRPKYNEDTDICLQVLADGWCTIAMNAFCVDKLWTMQLKGGNTPMYQGDGRLKMARSLTKDWPRVVSVYRRFQRPQHLVKGQWRGFDTPLIRRDDFVPPTGTDELGLRLTVNREAKQNSRLVDPIVHFGLDEHLTP
jgi:hypothetical protein